MVNIDDYVIGIPNNNLIYVGFEGKDIRQQIKITYYWVNSQRNNDIYFVKCPSVDYPIIAQLPQAKRRVQPIGNFQKRCPY